LLSIKLVNSVVKIIFRFCIWYIFLLINIIHTGKSQFGKICADEELKIFFSSGLGECYESSCILYGFLNTIRPYKLHANTWVLINCLLNDQYSINSGNSIDK